MTIVMPYPRNGGPGVDSAIVTCLKGCDEQEVGITDTLGNVTFLDVEFPPTVGIEKLGYITRQATWVLNHDSLVFSHVWPDEAEGSFGRLQIPDSTILHWGEDHFLKKSGLGGTYRHCPVIAVGDLPESREHMLYVLEHELYHAHQDGVTEGVCRTSGWVNLDEGKAYIEAWQADRKAERLVPGIDTNSYYQTPKENSARFYAEWAGEGSGRFPREDLCIAKARCQFMEDHYGPRPDGYP